MFPQAADALRKIIVDTGYIVVGDPDMQLISSSFPRGIHGFPVLFARFSLFRLLDERRNFFAEGGKLPLQIDALKDRRAFLYFSAKAGSLLVRFNP